MTDMLKRISAYLGREPGDILSHYVYSDHVAVIVNNGIKGCPKHIIPLDELPPVPAKRRKRKTVQQTDTGRQDDTSDSD